MPILSQQKQSQNTDFPNIRPSLDLRFALAKKLDPRITFTRGSTGTYFGPDGLMRTAGVNEPRFDHDPITGQSLGLLIEESRTNLVTYSEDFGNAAWTKLGSSVSTNISITTAPDNSNNADKLIEDTTNGEHRFLSSNITWVGNTRYTFTLFVKAAERTRVNFLFGTAGNWSGGREVSFDLISGTILSTDGATGNITKLSNGWYRCSATALSVASPTASLVAIRMINTGTNSSYQGDGTSGIYIWGAQVEAGAFPTSYIPTTASTVTRSADNASMTGTNFSSWYNQSEGTIYIETDKLYPGNFDTYRHYYNINSGTNQNEITAYVGPSATTITNYGITNGGRQVFDYVGINVYSNPTRFKIGQSVNSKYSFFKTSTGTSTPQLSSRAAPNGQNLSIATNMTQLGIGCQYTGGSFVKHINSHIARFTYYPIQITNQQLINLTS